MPVEHQVWFRFKDDISDERIEEHIQGLQAMKDKIEGVHDLKVGRNFTDRANGHQLGLSVTLRDKTALEAYASDPEHQAVAKPLAADCDSIMALDFEFEDED